MYWLWWMNSNPWFMNFLEWLVEKKKIQKIASHTPRTRNKSDLGRNKFTNICFFLYKLEAGRKQYFSVEESIGLRVVCFGKSSWYCNIQTEGPSSRSAYSQNQCDSYSSREFFGNFFRGLNDCCQQVMCLLDRSWNPAERDELVM